MTNDGLRETVWLIVCESSPRWLPALKSVMSTDVSPSPAFRVRGAGELPTVATLSETSAPVLVLVEVGTENLPELLTWVRTARRSPTAAIVALLDRSVSPTTNVTRGEQAREVLLEAGAVCVLRSTSELPNLLPIAGRHAGGAGKAIDADASLRDAVWRRLPWQPDPWPLR